MGAFLDRGSRALAHRRAPAIIFGTLALIPLAVATTRPGPARAPWIGNGSLLAPALHIVDPSAVHGAVLAAPLRATGIGVEVDTPATFLASTPSGAWWISEAAANSVTIGQVRTRIAAGARVLIDGDNALSRALLGISETAPPVAVAESVATTAATTAAASRLPAQLAMTAGVAEPSPESVVVPNGQRLVAERLRSTDMRGIRVRWDVNVGTVDPSVPGRVLASTLDGAAALFLSLDGRLLWSRPSLSDGTATLRLPSLPQILSEQWGISPRVERRGFDLYVDPDEEGKVKPDVLTQRWADAGVRRVYVAGWKQNADVDWRYDYRALARAAHKRHLEVYAWLEWPHVDFSFWRRHADCRERTAEGRVGKVNWRELVAVEVPDCFEAAWAQTRTILRAADFDGVNIADLTFDSPYFGPRAPEYYTPFHPDVRRDFANEYGFDPIDLVRDGPRGWKKNPVGLQIWQAYRARLLKDVYAKLLSRIEGVPAGRHIVVTLMDDRADGEIGKLVRDNSAQATKSLLALRATHPFELQLRDPVPFRSQDTTTVVAVYSPARAGEPILAVDFVRRGLVGSERITDRPVGLELYQNVADAARATTTVSLFGSGAIAPDDLGWIRFALAASTATVREHDGLVETSSSRSFTLRLRGRARQILIDGERAGSGTSVDVPAGVHTIRAM